jgi:hypothetical protein
VGVSSAYKNGTNNGTRNMYDMKTNVHMISTWHTLKERKLNDSIIIRKTRENTRKN